MEFKIEFAKETDAKETILVRWKSWTYTYKNIFTEKQINDFFEQKLSNEQYINDIAKSIKDNRNWFVAKIENKIVAVMSLGFPEQNEGKAEVFCLYCLPEYLRKGIGSKLFDKAIKVFKSKNIKTFVVCALKENYIGNSFYIKKCGKIVGEYKKEIIGLQKVMVEYKFLIN